jgi:hypothetical protein
VLFVAPIASAAVMMWRRAGSSARHRDTRRFRADVETSQSDWRRNRPDTARRAFCRERRNGDASDKIVSDR